MKPELTRQLKAKFFTLYWGQQVQRVVMSNHTPLCKVSHHYTGDNISNDWLELKPLTALSEEHAIIIALQNRFAHPASDEIKAKVGRDILNRVFGDHDYGNCLPFESADFLRGNGYALPWFCTELNRLVKVGEQEEAGWIKLTEVPA